MTKNYQIIQCTLTVLLVVSILSVGSAFAHSSKKLSGCFDAKYGSFDAARGNNSTDVIGLYKMLLVPIQRNKGQHAVFLRGPFKGTPLERTSTGALTRHFLGTNNRVGTLTSGDDQFDEFIVNKGSCFGEDGIPLFIEGTEIMNFSSGTGIFSGLVSGRIEWHGISNSCDDPNNRVADYEIFAGTLCFE